MSCAWAAAAAVSRASSTTALQPAFVRSALTRVRIWVATLPAGAGAVVVGRGEVVGRGRTRVVRGVTVLRTATAATAWVSASTAAGHAQDMATNNYFSHTSKDGRSFVDRIKAQGYPVPRSENIAAGQPTVTTVMDAWMASSGHRANILDCSAVAMGAASATGGSYGIYWVQDFGR